MTVSCTGGSVKTVVPDRNCQTLNGHHTIRYNKIQYNTIQYNTTQ